MRKIIPFIGKFLYAFLFLVVLPILLWFWAKCTEHLIPLPEIESRTLGWMFSIVGGLLMLWGMLALMVYGKGLPMNAFPPSKFVRRGPYRFFRHPIYWGFGILIIGFFILTGIPSGLWLVTPITILSMISLVWGYEKIDLDQRFPDETIKTVLDLPDENNEPAKNRDRIASLFWLSVFLLLANCLTIIWSYDMPALLVKRLNFQGIENPFLPILSSIFIVVTPFLIRQKDYLREWVLSGIIACNISILITLLFPVLGAQHLPPIDKLSATGSELTIGWITIPIFLLFISLKAIYRQSRRLGIFFIVIVGPLLIIQLTNSRSPAAHLIVSLFIFLLATNYNRIWLFLKNTSEQIANSWKEWEYGKIRLINHGFYVGFGAFLGIFISGILVGKTYAWAILVFAITVIVFSALWAQIIEGSEKLKRPYGFYGALVGIIFASVAVWAMGLNVWVIIGVISVVMPWVQAIGRLRCLVNGCCHGSLVNNSNIGIRYFHHRSRVCSISGLKGEWLHPTPLYSILWLFVVGLILLSLWKHHFPPSFIFGLYLILNGIGRFVEEAYRGEVQTPIVKGLRLYQWTAIITIFIGIIMTVIQVNPIAITPDFGWEIILAAAIGGLFTTFAMGVDFPYSNARFSRLV